MQLGTRELGEMQQRVYGYAATHNALWILCAIYLPPPHVDVLTWDERRGISLGQWIDRDDLPQGRYWEVGGKCGGIGTRFEIHPPTHWMPRPYSPRITD